MGIKYSTTMKYGNVPTLSCLDKDMDAQFNSDTYYTYNWDKWIIINKVGELEQDSLTGVDISDGVTFIGEYVSDTDDSDSSSYGNENEMSSPLIDHTLIFENMNYHRSPLEIIFEESMEYDES